MVRIADATWGLKQEFRSILHFTVSERLILHGAATCAPNLTSCQRKLLLTTQKKYLLFITGVYRTTPTAVLQSITGILTLYLKAEQKAVYVRAARLRRYLELRIPIHIHPKLIIRSDIRSRNGYVMLRSSSSHCGLVGRGFAC
ncbi:hypothetical protein AVEN_43555-1 [Araneus ventricosus]|uniref:Uncharacterized protein n=1 Tax=Araneus ventricosus TaxID=182803 RepID=A0A4Y2EJ49_ARAVE|nr:hypothetical protein AVEN_43555-1 [Araneus ventricosus]